MAHYLITGHTGFKGAWLIFLLKARGHEVSGLALDPLPGSIFERTELHKDLIYDFRVDVRNREETVKAVRRAKPDYLIHMAAQALVREGYRNPRYTYDTNVTGTSNVLEASDQTDSIKAQLIVTTDKVYLDQGLKRPYVETDPLGGKDPYSASKAMADILSQEYLSRDGAKPGAVVRAGNVVGTGDISVDRLIPDAVAAIVSKTALIIRNPNHVRPWQHVLDCLDGYMKVLSFSQTCETSNIFNIGPDPGRELSVGQVVEMIGAHTGGLLFDAAPSSRESVEDPYLCVDSARASELLGWAPQLTTEDSIRWALQGIGALAKGDLLRQEISSQVTEYYSNLRYVQAHD